mgnify:CR=1 FL=1
MGRDVWVDRFRPVAAAMVVAIHTAPLAEVSPVLGEAVVYGVFRVAVPFFLMVAGRYVLAPFITRHPGSRERVRRYVRRSIATYLLATAAYLPLMAYAGNLPGSVPAFLLWLLVDGTVYHLWYFPALVLGLAVCCALSRLGVRVALVAAATLYLVGVGGDSYFGAVGAAGPLEPLYGALFSCVEYTRNGLFYAPLFLMLGAAASPASKGFVRRDGALLAASLIGVAAEACVTSALGWQRHDSMYRSLPHPVVRAPPDSVSPRCRRAGVRGRLPRPSLRDRGGARRRASRSGRRVSRSAIRCDARALICSRHGHIARRISYPCGSCWSARQRSGD